MPKLKTRRSAAKRFRVTGTGKLVRRRASKNHLLQHKTSTRKNRLSHMALLHETDIDRVHGMLPYVKRPQRSLDTTTVESSHDQS
ncbi:MAG: 50S ribosomal protein L35 [Pseudanabaenaceae cyanobacterium]